MPIRNAPSVRPAGRVPAGARQGDAPAHAAHVRAVGQSYLAQGLGIADALAAIYFHELRYDPANLQLAGA